MVPALVNQVRLMNRRTAEKILHEVLSLPTAPFAEHHVIEYIRAFVASRKHVTARTDPAGNVLVRYRFGKRRVARPVCLTAHMDHPGFVAARMVGRHRLRAHWRGSVAPEYFKGARCRFFSRGEWIRGKVSSTITVKRGARTVVKSATIHVPRPVEPGSPGMWDFPDPVVRDGRIHARGCDDLAGAAALLSCIDHLDRHHPTGEAFFLFTRAEEVGFVGAMAACKHKTIPKRCAVVAVETSSQRPHARVGDGPILRVGDRVTTFTSAATRLCEQVADDLAAQDKGFTYQRKLMDGGMCESTAFCELGYHATGICVALGNYHNMNTRKRKLAAEYVDLGDYAGLVKWFIALAETKRRYTGADDALNDRLERLQKEYRALLERTVGGPA